MSYSSPVLTSKLASGQSESSNLHSKAVTDIIQYTKYAVAIGFLNEIPKWRRRVSIPAPRLPHLLRLTLHPLVNYLDFLSNSSRLLLYNMFFARAILVD
ncbi:hypothetical protein AVEN_36010-1 [Araneus ventricosus]|uniref:Uncharacterized protein n=1 Tax=Araneus ventricosus TaxID=182803 RepID=A0A4Y2KJW1_ARAVE|nr:hypothetical protein AVEN_36010-1 [Araneus ventricosus]